MRITNIIKMLWVVICVCIAAWGTLAGKDADLVAIYLIGVLTLPSGLLIYILGSFALSAVVKFSPNFSVTYDSAISAVMFALAILAGYWQWFILLPKIINRMRNERSPKVWGLLILGLVIILYGLYRFYINAFPGRI